MSEPQRLKQSSESERRAKNRKKVEAQKPKEKASKEVTLKLTPYQAGTLKYVLGLFFMGPRSLGRDQVSANDKSVLREIFKKIDD